MGCGCGRNKNTKGSKKPKIVSKNKKLIFDIKNKQSICDNCSFSKPISNKIISRKKTKVSVKKKCKLLNKAISEIIANNNYKCPKEKF